MFLLHLGPILMTIGPWRPIALEFYQNRIIELDVRSEVSESLDVKLSGVFTFSEKTAGYVSFLLMRPDGSLEVSANKLTVDKGGRAKVDFEWQAGHLELWNPVGYGAQPLYTVEVELTDRVSRSYVSASCYWFCFLSMAMCWIKRPTRLLSDVPSLFKTS